jgi:hypothetical protein
LLTNSWFEFSFWVIKKIINLKDDLFLTETMAAQWDESYINANPTAFADYKLRVAFMMRMMDNFGVGEFQGALKVLNLIFYLKF